METQEQEEAPRRRGAVCAVCARQYAKYLCPRCGVKYCSLPCFKTHNGACTEGFYKQHVVDSLKGQRASLEDRKKVLEMLARERECAEEEEESLEPGSNNEEEDHERLLQLQKMLEDPAQNSDVEALLATLSERQRRAWRRCISEGALEVEPWRPWWCSALVQPLNADGTPQEEENVPPLPLDIPAFRTLFPGTKEPSPLLPNSLLQILYTYVYTIQLYNGEFAGDPEDALDVALSLCPVMCGNATYERPDEALLVPFAASNELPDANSQEYSVACFGELGKLLLRKRYVAAALADLLALTSQVASCSGRDSSAGGDDAGAGKQARRRLAAVSRKLVFFLAWVNDCVPEGQLRTLAQAVAECQAAVSV
eukprot:TRINITY_DN10753_c0_g1_i1.p1 TRINITY_DN10753_c0_g1~~TRINITY_DN10753_c0_g1_i1.p1  ORF type:complete len:368 (+),score=114.42 TRINITY_DN10753_c0_g1_i1:2-1105(+)